MELVKTNYDLCTGCNRCVRECPMELANITHTESDGSIKVDINREMCITCGRCFTACHHNARHYGDDTERFFEDLAKEVPISLMVAPAIRTNIPNWERVLTYLKERGVKSIFDVSMGADICTWAHIRYIEKNGAAPLITQPCPVIVTYCETYSHDLLKKLSPVHSPMGCTSVYIKKYKGVTDRIAALSPCIAKSNEFESTGIADYNVTFKMLAEYLESNKIKLPKKKTGFDHDESGLGKIFPAPGGLRENIRFLTDSEISIDKAEGFSVFESLKTYAETPPQHLPLIFDVLNCDEGCNKGIACEQTNNEFEINRTMDSCRAEAVNVQKRAHFDALHRKYDETLDLSLFLRKYKPKKVKLQQITDEDIEEAFALLDKIGTEEQTVDCGACGSNTCYNMARKIALGVNIPTNCIVKSLEDARKEHVKNVESQRLLDTVEKLREADERMRMLLDSTPVSAHFWDRDYNLVDCNETAYKLFEMTNKQEYMERYYDLTPELQPDGSRSADMLRHMIDTAYETGHYRAEFMRQSLDKVAIPMEITLVRVENKGEHLVASYCRDLREHVKMLGELTATTSQLETALQEAKTAVHALEAAQSTTTAMFGSNPQINILFDANYKAVDCNPAAMIFMGYDTIEETTKNFLNDLARSVPAFQSNGRPSVSISEKLVAASAEGRVKFETEVILDSEVKTLDVEFIRIPYEHSYGIVAYVLDMTAVRNREKELIQSRELNELQLAKLDLIVQASNIALWDMEVFRNDPVNPNNVFVWTEEFRQMLGFESEEEFPNVLNSWSERLHPDDKDRVLAAFADHMLDITGETPFNEEYRLLKKNNEWGYFQATGETLRDDYGNPLRVVGSLFDITKTKHIIIDTEKQKREAQAANIAKSAFLSTMSHEIRTPMNAILGFTEIQLQDSSLSESVRDTLERIYSSGNMLLGIINDILDMSKIEAGKLELILDNYDTASLISDTAQLNMMRIGSKAIDFELQVDENTAAHLFGDELRIKQILNNILSNAFKYTAKGMVTLAALTEETDNENEVILVLKVKDTGQGMNPEQVEKLFDEYSQFNQESNRATEGTGLGMSITRNLIRMMNGEILIESEPGVGTEFTVRLPQVRTNMAVLGKEVADNLHKFQTSSRAQMKRLQIDREPMPYGNVLVVDDVETNVFVAKGLLIPYELNIDSTDSGFGAIEKVKNGFEYDIIFMDHMMPKMDGIETTKRLRDMGYKQPIVALTANAVAGQSEIFLKNGFDDFISKPIDIRQLNSVLNKLVRDKQTPEVIEAAREQAMKKKKEQSEESAQQSMNAALAEIFVRDARKSLAVLDEIFEKGSPPSEEELRTFVIHVHGLKSALANVGKMDLSAIALKLETLGRDEEVETILAESPAFLASLRDFIDELGAAVDAEEGDAADAADDDLALLHEKLEAIKAACEEYDESIAETALQELQALTWSPKVKELLSAISEHLLHSDFDEVVSAVGEYLGL